MQYPKGSQSEFNMKWGSLTMRDLKHLNWFENLLQEANNALIAQAKQEGKICVAFVCENTPEPLMNLGNAFGIPPCTLRTPARWTSQRIT